ncbi:hypothetical protein ACKKBG_A10035 [Auxenochlorella protothecoides x Auxenochlorella symbiontica]
MSLSNEQLEAFERDGYLVIPDFTPREEVAAMRSRALELVAGFQPPKAVSVFDTKDQTSKVDQYFLDSAGAISFFFEAGAFDSQGAQVKPKELAINKIGHALHDLDPIFQAWSYSPRVCALAQSLGLRRPLPMQSMYIFKQPGIGGEVVPHQDSTFLFTDPPSVVGLWLALEDATLQNGCLWAIPGSHKAGVARRFLRAPDGRLAFDAPPAVHAEADFVALPMPAGALVLLHGALVHRSNENRSPASRHAFSVHVLEGAAGTRYPATNWLQRPAGMPVAPLYEPAAVEAA